MGLLDRIFGKKKYKTIDVPTFKQMSGQKDTVILDVRAKHELKDGFVTGYRQLDLMSAQFRQQLTKMDKSKTYLVYCRSGMRSRRACNIMAKMGYENLYNLKGGYMAYSNS